MKKPDISELKEKFSYDPDTGLIHWKIGRRKDKQAFTYTSKRGYKATTFRGKKGDTSLSAHRVAWAVHYGEWPSGQIDHINGNRIDNRLVNLRCVENSENARNMKISSGNTSGCTGVYKHSQTGKWTAQIDAFGKTVGLGCFEAFGDAVIARKAAERALGYHQNHGRPK